MNIIHRMKRLIHKIIMEGPRAVFEVISTRLAHRRAVYKKNKCCSEKRGDSYHILYILGSVDGESKRYRVYNVKEALSPLGVTGRVVTTELLPFQNPKQYDLIVFFRCVKNAFTNGFLTRCKASGIPVIYDIDDLIFDPRIAEQLQILRHLSIIHVTEILLSYKNLMELCDYVTASTQYLCDYISAMTAKQTFLIRNGLNREQLEIAAKIDQSSGAEYLIGFLSGSNTHDADFKQTVPALERVLVKYPNIKLVIIGPVELPDSIKNLGNRVQKLPYMDYRKFLNTCNRLYAAVIPLEYESAFCNAKSELKYFEQALIGVPVIASPTAPYRECITHGVNGMLAKDTEAWENALSRIIEDIGFRDMLAKNAKEHIKDIYYPKAIGAQAHAVYSQILASKKQRLHKKQTIRQIERKSH